MKPKTAHIFHVTLEGWCYVENDSSQMNPKSCRSAGRPGSANRQSVGTGILSLNVVGLGLSRLRGAQGWIKEQFILWVQNMYSGHDSHPSTLTVYCVVRRSAFPLINWLLSG